MTYHRPIGIEREYSFPAILAASQRINWKVEDLIGGDKQLDFTRPFLPESLARVTGLTMLTPREQMILNQIRGHGYLYTFGLVEEFILPFVMDHARARLDGDNYRARAFLQFASEEAKHIHLFKRFREAFTARFGTACEVIGPPQEIARVVLAHQPLAVAFLILHIEWMTQRHYVDSVRDDHELDPQFKSLLKHHWMEESQHAKLDTLMVEAIAAECDREQIMQAVKEYAEIGGMLDAGLKQQAAFDMDALMQATGRAMSTSEREAAMAIQHQALRWTFLGTGMTHPKFLSAVGKLSQAARAQIEMVAPAFC